MSDPAQENHPGNPTRESPSSEHGDLDDVSVDSGLDEAVASGPLTDGADSAEGADRSTKPAGSHGE
jgi:hypothetical protein